MSGNASPLAWVLVRWRQENASPLAWVLVSCMGPCEVEIMIKAVAVKPNSPRKRMRVHNVFRVGQNYIHTPHMNVCNGQSPGKKPYVAPYMHAYVWFWPTFNVFHVNLVH